MATPAAHDSQAPHVGRTSGLVRGVIVLQCLWFAGVVALSVRSYWYRHSLRFMEGAASAIVADLLLTWVPLAAVIAAVAGLLWRRRWGLVAAVFVNVSILGIPPLVLWLFIYGFFPDARASIGAPVVSLMSLALAAPFMAPRVREGFS